MADPHLMRCVIVADAAARSALGSTSEMTWVFQKDTGGMYIDTGPGLVQLPGATAVAQPAAVADLTFGANITAATANGALADSSATNPTEAQFNELAKELGTKINAILAALRTTGAIAT